MRMTLAKALDYKSSRLKWIVEPKDYEEMIEIGIATAVIDFLQQELKKLNEELQEIRNTCYLSTL